MRICRLSSFPLLRFIRSWRLIDGHSGMNGEELNRIFQGIRRPWQLVWIRRRRIVLFSAISRIFMYVNDDMNIINNNNHELVRNILSAIGLQHHLQLFCMIFHVFVEIVKNRTSFFFFSFFLPFPPLSSPKQSISSSLSVAIFLWKSHPNSLSMMSDLQGMDGIKCSGSSTFVWRGIVFSCLNRALLFTALIPCRSA